MPKTDSYPKLDIRFYLSTFLEHLCGLHAASTMIHRYHSNCGTTMALRDGRGYCVEHRHEVLVIGGRRAKQYGQGKFIGFRRVDRTNS